VAGCEIANRRLEDVFAVDPEGLDLTANLRRLGAGPARRRTEEMG
jgi:hypothetical protein